MEIIEDFKELIKLSNASQNELEMNYRFIGFTHVHE